MDGEPVKKTSVTRECLLCGLVLTDGSVVCPQDGSALKRLKSDPFVGMTLVDRYEILALIGTGGMGNVYRSRHKLMDRIVAIKILHSDRISSASRFKRFQQEARMASSLSHPNIVAAFDFGITPDEIPFLVMDYIEGTSLEAVLRQKGALSSERCISIFSQACDALAHAHQKGIIHRDIKPSNIMLAQTDTSAEMVKVLDFGIAKTLPQFEHGEASLTMTGEFFGSPQYMSPEQCTGKELDARSDVYSLGCVIYESLTGRPPIVGDNLLDTIFKHSNEAPPAFKSIRPDLSVPEQLEAVVFKALEKNPENRFQSMTILKRNLEFAPRFAEHACNFQPANRKSWLTKRLKHPALMPSALAVLCLLLAGLACAEVLCNHAISFGVSEWRLKLDEKLAGGDSGKLIPVLAKLGKLYAAHGSWGKAIQTYEQALSCTVAVHGENSLPAAQSWIALGNLYQDVHNRKSKFCWKNACSILLGQARANRTAGKYADNEAIDSTIIELQKRYLGDEQADIVASLVLQAEDLREAGRLDAAEPLYKEAIAMTEKVLGKDNVAVADVMADLASCFVLRQKYSQAEDQYKQALTLKTRVLGEKSSDVAALHTSLARLYLRQGRYNEAEASFLDALAVERAAGGETEKVALALDDLASLYKDWRKYREAQDMYQMSLSLKEKLAASPSSQATTLDGLASVSFLQAQYPKAEELFRRELDLWPKDSARQRRIDALQHLQDTCKAEGKELEARDVEERMRRVP